MLTVSLHGIAISAARGLYAEEHKLDNRFEVDVDVFINVPDISAIPFVDYTIIRAAVDAAFKQPYGKLEEFIQHIHRHLGQDFTDAEKIRVAIKKLNPPMHGQTAYAQVIYEG
ncbi:MAG: dihydroneopterin aldolase [Taibaiella sp.]|nr:dihydroneopterin aldolase [Taibaiella sp.]